MEKKFRILCLISTENKTTWNKLIKEWEKYFNFNVIFDKPKNIDKYNKKPIDLLFMDSKQPIANEIYELHKNANNNFTVILISDKPSEEDIFKFKNLTDRMVYTGISYEYTKWSTIASLRRFWEQYSKPSTIIYRNIIADFVEQKFLINQREEALTSKEIQLLQYFMNHRGEIITKDAIFRDVWGYDTPDSTRTFDQMFFKLKSKIGKEYFSVKRNKGIIFE